MSHAPHPYQPVTQASAMAATAFDPRRAVRNPHYAQAPHHPGYPAQIQGPAPMMRQVAGAYPAAPHGGYPPYAPHVAPSHIAGPHAGPAPYGASPMVARPGTAHMPPLSKKDIKRAAKRQKAYNKAQAKAQKQATRKRSSLIPFILGMLVGAVMTIYLSSAVFAPRQLDGPAWTLPSSSDVPLAEAVPDEDVIYDEGEG